MPCHVASCHLRQVSVSATLSGPHHVLRCLRLVRPQGRNARARRPSTGSSSFKRSRRNRPVPIRCARSGLSDHRPTCTLISHAEPPSHTSHTPAGHPLCGLPICRALLRYPQRIDATVPARFRFRPAFLGPAGSSGRVSPAAARAGGVPDTVLVCSRSSPRVVSIVAWSRIQSVQLKLSSSAIAASGAKLGICEILAHHLIGCRRLRRLLIRASGPSYSMSRFGRSIFRVAAATRPQIHEAKNPFRSGESNSDSKRPRAGPSTRPISSSRRSTSVAVISLSPWSCNWSQ